MGILCHTPFPGLSNSVALLTCPSSGAYRYPSLQWYRVWRRPREPRWEGKTMSWEDGTLRERGAVVVGRGVVGDARGKVGWCQFGNLGLFLMGGRELLKVVKVGLIRIVYRKNDMAAGHEFSSHLCSYKGPLTGLPDSTHGLSISSQYYKWNKAFKPNQIRSVIHSTHPSEFPWHASTWPNVTHHLLSYIAHLPGTSNTSLLAIPQTYQLFAVPSGAPFPLRYPHDSQAHFSDFYPNVAFSWGFRWLHACAQWGGLPVAGSHVLFPSQWFKGPG